MLPHRRVTTSVFSGVTSDIPVRNGKNPLLALPYAYGRFRQTLATHTRAAHLPAARRRAPARLESTHLVRYQKRSRDKDGALRGGNRRRAQGTRGRKACTRSCKRHRRRSSASIARPNLLIGQPAPACRTLDMGFSCILRVVTDSSSAFGVPCPLHGAPSRTLETILAGHAPAFSESRTET